MTRFPTNMVFVDEAGEVFVATLDLVDGRIVQRGDIEVAPARFDNLRRQLADQREQDDGEASPEPVIPCVVCGARRPGGTCDRLRASPCGGCPTRKARVRLIVDGKAKPATRRRSCGESRHRRDQVDSSPPPTIADRTI